MAEFIPHLIPHIIPPFLLISNQRVHTNGKQQASSTGQQLLHCTVRVPQLLSASPSQPLDSFEKWRGAFIRNSKTTAYRSECLCLNFL
jgi:hypothetical protein